MTRTRPKRRTVGTAHYNPSMVGFEATVIGHSGAVSTGRRRWASWRRVAPPAPAPVEPLPPVANVRLGGVNHSRMLGAEDRFWTPLELEQEGLCLSDGGSSRIRSHQGPVRIVPGRSLSRPRSSVARQI
jgi:hypothetical protein